MLSEGWDCRSVTHIMGLRAFTSQLLCEQVVGRGLRRTSYEVDPKSGLFQPEYVNIFGVPFTFLPFEGAEETAPRPPAPKLRIEPVPAKAEYAITWPNVVRVEHVYRPRLALDPAKVAQLALNEASSLQQADLAVLLGGYPDLAHLRGISLKDLALQLRLQRLVFRAAATIYDQMSPDWAGRRELLLAQLVGITEGFLRSDRLVVTPPKARQDGLRRRLVLALNMNRIVRHLWDALRFENAERLELVFDEARPIHSTGDMAPWYTKQALRPGGALPHQLLRERQHLGGTGRLRARPPPPRRGLGQERPPRLRNPLPLQGRPSEVPPRLLHPPVLREDGHPGGQGAGRRGAADEAEVPGRVGARRERPRRLRAVGVGRAVRSQRSRVDSGAGRPGGTRHRGQSVTPRADVGRSRRREDERERRRRLTALLLKDKDALRTGEWPGLTEFKRRPSALDKRSANRFFLGAILDYQIPADTAWANAQWLVDELGDPDDLWGAITSVPLAAWNARWREYQLHRYPKAHERIWTIGRRVRDDYGGDARDIWRGQLPNEVLARLDALRVGDQIAHMIAGVLRDTGQLKGTGDVKADLHVRHVLGRVLTGDGPLPPTVATAVTREQYPADPWRLDAPLYWLGRRVCKAPVPDCDRCYLRQICLFYQGTRR